MVCPLTIISRNGPNFINSILDVLTAWRLDEVAFTGDVRKMFNQILVHPDDQALSQVSMEE